MKLLLGTHARLWWLSDDERLQTRSRDLIADPSNDVLVSTVSLWEIAVKVRVRKVEADIAEITRSVEQSGFTPLHISAAHLSTLGALPPHPDHRDPFDHLLISQAMTEDATLVSEDSNTSRYAVRCVPCSDRAGAQLPQ